MSTLKLDTLSNKAGTASVPSDTIVSGTAKAWVNFNGTGTVAIRRAFNVSSITDNGTGTYTLNFTTAMPDENYAVSGFTCRSYQPTARGGCTITYAMREDGVGTAPTASSLQIQTLTNSSAGSPAYYEDMAYNSITIFS